jgi:hypothetical protein
MNEHDRERYLAWLEHMAEGALDRGDMTAHLTWARHWHEASAGEAKPFGWVR